TFFTAFFAGFLATFLVAFFATFLAALRGAAFFAVFFTAFLAGFFLATFFVAMLWLSSSVGLAGTTAQYETHRGYRTRDQPTTRRARRTGFRAPAIPARHHHGSAAAPPVSLHRHEKTRCALRRGLHAS